MPVFPELTKNEKNEFGGENIIFVGKRADVESFYLMGDIFLFPSLHEGLGIVLIEAQALVSTAAYGTAQRSVTGFDGKRMNMLLAVLEKRVGFKLAQKDVFLNIAGGLKVNDPALDLAVICSILSSNVDMPIKKGICMSGEVGLSGEIRQVTRIEQRIGEAEKLGFSTMIIPKNNLKGVNTSRLGIQLVEVSKVEEAFRYLFG